MLATLLPCYVILYMKAQLSSKNYFLKNLKEMDRNEAEFESPALWVLIVTYLNYGVLTLFGWCRDLLRFYGIEKTLGAKERSCMTQFAPLYQSIEGFYTRNVYNRLGDAFCRPICRQG